MSLNKTIIGFTGPKQSGKSTAAEYLVAGGFKKLSFAEPIKDMTWYFLRCLGCDAHYIEQLLTVKKEVVIPGLGVSARHIMQTLGTDWGRDTIHPNLWVMLMSNRLANEDSDYLVFDDIRFENEASAIRSLGGLIIHINRGDLVSDDLHESEAGIELHKDDGAVDNDYAVAGFLADVDAAVAEFVSA